MLLSLRIENFALIDDLQLDFGAGLNVLTGETGAGKSIILDALDAILGGKVSGRSIRTGAERSLLEASFSLSPVLKTWLTEQEIESLDEDLLICSREISLQQGTLRSRSRLNGILVNRQQLQEIRDRLVTITAQGQAVHLGRSASQRDWLDGFGGLPLITQRNLVTEAFSKFQQAEQALEHYRQTERQRLQQLDILQYQLQELQQAQLTFAEEKPLLEQEYQRLVHSVELQQQSYLVYQTLYEQPQGQACTDLLGDCVTRLEDMSQYDSQLTAILELVQEALTQVQEAGRQINSYSDSLEADPLRLEEVESRLTVLKQICRKYGPDLADAIAHQEKIQQELAELTSAEQSQEALSQAYQHAQTQLIAACRQLTERRQQVAQDLQSRILQELAPLAMQRVQFQVELQAIAPTAFGADQVSFWFSPNPGEPLQPLSETASGGEMSRFLLALQVCFSQVNPVGSLVFDEVDVGISGRVTQAIAQKLHQLSQSHQVLCVTHQPIVAAMADHHLRVEKQVIEPPDAVISPEDGASKEAGVANSQRSPDRANQRTVVRVAILDQQQRRQELAQLAGGQSGEQAIAFAESLLSQANSTRHHEETAVGTKAKRKKLKTAKPA
jgi:DNA repair protein RecN (Recombination protein N)